MKLRELVGTGLGGTLLGVVAILLLCTAGGASVQAAAGDDTTVSQQTPQASGRLSLPAVFNSSIPPSQQLCRLGVGGTALIAEYPVRPLKLGWYLDWQVTAKPARPDGIGYLPMIRLSQSGLDSYSSTPSVTEVPALVAARRGAVWVIGNEPDRVSWQDSLEPAVYAHAYHDLYGVIKQTDPTARVAIAGLVEPTPLRLQYLDMILQAYRSLYGVAMPIDVWTMHAFVLRERSCVAYPDDCWGAEIPPGIPATEGMLYTIEDHDRLDLFKGFITSFRQWIADRGYQNRPLLITEFGILMPADYGFDAARVNSFMQGASEFLASASGPTGYARDENRLVQGWAWYSLDDPMSNGFLFDQSTHQRTVFGDKFVALASAMHGDVNLRPFSATATRTGSGTGEKVTLAVTVANSGNSAIPGAFSVRIYHGNPSSGLTPIATEPWVYALEGCGATFTVSTTWTGAPASAADLWVVVDPANLVPERNESDNGLGFTLPAR